MQMKVGFLLLIGLPGSGKTTLAKHLVRNFDECSENARRFVHICYDEMISFPNDNQEFVWKLARHSVLVKLEKLVVAIKNKNFDLCPEEFKNEFVSIKSWDCDFVLVLDDNMYLKSMRYYFFQIAKKHEVGFCQAFLNCSLEKALLVNSLRESHSVPSHVIENMLSKIEPPNLKNNWEKYSIELEAFCNLNELFNRLLPVLNESLINFFYEKDDTESRELSKIQCMKSMIHQTDLALRKIINCKIKKYFERNSKKDSKDFISGLNLRKSEVLSDIKSGDICIPEEILAEINSDIVEKFLLINFLNGYF